MPRRLRNHSEVRQKDEGRWALGIPHSTVSKEFIGGELGWSSFDARETTSKTMYFERIKQMDQTRWPKSVLTATEITNTKVTVIERLKKMRSQFDLEDLEMTRNTLGTPMWNKFRRELKTRVQKKLDSLWKRNMEAKSTLCVYRQSKETRGLKADMYDNSRGSRLLALARAGMLPTRQRQHTRDPSIDINCARCGAPETDQHVILECEEGKHSQQEFPYRLGLYPETTGRRTSDGRRKS